MRAAGYEPKTKLPAAAGAPVPRRRRPLRRARHHPPPPLTMTMPMATTPCPYCHPDPDRVFYQGRTVFGLWDRFPVSPDHDLLVTHREEIMNRRSPDSAFGEPRFELEEVTSHESPRHQLARRARLVTISCPLPSRREAEARSSLAHRVNVPNRARRSAGYRVETRVRSRKGRVFPGGERAFAGVRREE